MSDPFLNFYHHAQNAITDVVGCSVGTLLCDRELDEAAKRHGQQVELQTSRIAELDAEGRRLRDIKYTLDTQVCIADMGMLSYERCMTCAVAYACCPVLSSQGVVRIADDSRHQSVMLKADVDSSCEYWCRCPS